MKLADALNRAVRPHGGAIYLSLGGSGLALLDFRRTQEGRETCRGPCFAAQCAGRVRRVRVRRRRTAGRILSARSDSSNYTQSARIAESPESAISPVFAFNGEPRRLAARSNPHAQRSEPRLVYRQGRR